MDLSKAFDTINHKLLVAKLHAYGFDISALEIIYDYLSNRFQRTKINSSFSSWSLMLSGMPQGSVNGPKWFNYYINDMFFLFVYTSVCNMADDTTPFACDSSLDTLIKKLENDVTNVIEWFESNYMILNASKCHLLVSGPKNHVEQISIEVGGEVIWESLKEKLLGVTIDKQLKMNSNLSDILQKAGTILR